jgi:hypothetical protein
VKSLSYAAFLTKSIYRVKFACELSSEEGLGAATLNAFDINRVALASEANFSQVEPYRHALAVLLLISTDTQDELTRILARAAIVLTETYESVRESAGLFLPSSVPGLRLAQAYEVFDNSVKFANEPYSATGDFDGDGATNLSEYTAFVIDEGGDIQSFLNAATDTTILPPGSEGEGEGEGGPVGCAASEGTPQTVLVGNGILLAFLTACLLLLPAGRRKE